METTLYDRNPLRVEAVQVTEENLYEVAQWCGGDVNTNPQTGQKFIKVDVLHPHDAKHTRANVTNWILRSLQGYKIYSDTAFKNGYTEVTVEQELTEPLKFFS
jgi:hypothetical protein